MLAFWETIRRICKIFSEKMLIKYFMVFGEASKKNLQVFRMLWKSIKLSIEDP